MANEITNEVLGEKIEALGSKNEVLGEKIEALGGKIDKLETRFDDLEFATKEGFDEQGKRLDHLERGQDELKHSVAKNGDALTHLTNRFEAESAASQNRFARIETRLDHTGLLL